MLELFIAISKYLNIIYIFLFLVFGTIYVINERYDVYYRGNYDLRQFFMIVLMNITCGIILCFSNLDITDINTFLFFVSITAIFITAKISYKIAFNNACPVLWNGVFFLLDLGLIELYRLYPNMAFKQLIFVVVGLVVIAFIPLVLSIIPRVEYFGIIFFILTIGLILLPFIFPKSEYGALNWVSIPVKGINVTFQPSELAKILYIFFIASLFRKKVGKFKMFISIVFSAFLVLVLVYQNDLGGALMYFMTFLALFLVGTNNYLLVFIALMAGGVSSYFAYGMFSHVKVRVDTWLDPFSYAQTGGYQVLQSWFAMGTNGLLGSGLGNGYPKYVPVVESDFIYSAIAEEFGGIFAILLIFVYVMVFYRMINISLRSRRKFYALLGVGVSGLLYFQTLLILGGVTGFMPLTGVTLPFISAGGSSILVSIVMIGVIQWVHGRNNIQNKIEIVEQRENYDVMQVEDIIELDEDIMDEE